MTAGRSSSGSIPMAGDEVRPYGKYFLIRKLAEGGMAEIFLAKQVGAEGFERNVVIKRMLPHLSSVPDFVGMFLDEARLAARLAHPNIIQINDLGLEGGCYYICMEYQPGEDFSSVLRTASKRHEYVPINIVLRVVIEAAHGLQFAHDFTDDRGHSLNIVHRDISPSNIYVTYQGQVKLLDFGIAKAESRVTQTTAGVVKGKYMYMAPEQASTGVVDRRADVYSLGVTLYEGLTNTRPFARDSDLAILNAVLKGDFKPPRAVRPDLPAELDAAVMKALARGRDARYPNADAFALDLERYLAATSSGSGGTLVASYLAELFGEEHRAQRTRIPSLASLNRVAEVVDRSGREDLAGGELKRTVVEAPVTSSARSSKAALLGVALGVVAGLAALGALLMFKQTAPSEDAGLPAVVAVAPPDAGPPPDAGSAASLHPSADAGEAQHPATAHGPVPLSVEAIQRAMSRQYARVQTCFSEHMAELPESKGSVTVLFKIETSGKVSEARVEGPLAQTPVGACLERQLRTLVFPRNVNGPITLKQPLSFSRL